MSTVLIEPLEDDVDVCMEETSPSSVLDMVELWLMLNVPGDDPVSILIRDTLYSYLLHAAELSREDGEEFGVVELNKALPLLRATAMRMQTDIGLGTIVTAERDDD